MSFDKWIEESKEIIDKSVFIIKNGLEYKIAITNTQKPKYKKHKLSGRKKYYLSGIQFLGLAVTDQKEINEICKETPTENLAYEKVFQMQKNSFYSMTLTPKQYRNLVLFLEKAEIRLNEPFYMRRTGNLMTTMYNFYATPTAFKQSKLPVKPKLKDKNEISKDV